ncbi:50S ribosomal protein L25/general stress protein Ctc [Legionella londiniensis]|uniref:Large ribosomal subunit protein bL25 n=1 Tax=Legionella londiniensis TaxID=45068 RepID=A0A0W0VQ25_9GAMM|nr:50S ribosomal protein L25/general stress protein Ctc [Legionella londiniensis]KTD21897.1 50S ribosomal protein L25 [Legionella londiniensis]STX92620.1 50S ribosomal protein L25 [Legionella londiniensis]
MTTLILEAETRTDKGKGASRRLRRLENKVPAILYGGSKEPQAIHLLHNKVIKALESESIYSSVFDLKLGGKVEQVILKDLQRHPYKPVILHMDLQRVGAKDVLVKMVPIHFVNETEAKGVKAGGMINHTMNQVEVRCQAKDLPEFIEVDVSDMQLDDVLHLSDLKLPKGVQLTIEPAGDHDHPVVSIHKPKRAAEAEAETKEVPEAASEQGPEESAE